MSNSLLKMKKIFKYKFIQFFSSVFFQSIIPKNDSRSIYSRVQVGIVFRLISAFKSVNQCALSGISTTFVLSALLTACGGGGSSSETPAPNVPSTSLSLTVSSSVLTLSEDFSPALRIATATNVTEIRVSQSTTGVVNIITSVAGVSVSSIPNANGRTTVTITANSGTLSSTTQVVVQVTAVNDPPTLTVSSNSISTVGGFSPITINTTASDIEDANLTFTVDESSTDVVTVRILTNAIVLNTISGASGQTTLTVRAVDSSGATFTEIITVSVSITISAAPVVTVSTNLINVQEDFGTSVIIQTTATDAADTITVSVSASIPIVTAVISTPVNGQSTITNRITLTAIKDANGTATLTVLATDPGGQSKTTEIVVVVANVNDPPTLTVPTTTFTVLEDFEGARLVATLIDVDSGDSLTVTVTESNAGVVTVTTSASGVSVTAIANMNGRTTLNISVSDGRLSTTAQAVIAVTEVNDPPALSVSITALTLDEDFATVLIATTRTDIDSNTLTLTVTESTTGVVTVLTSTSGISVSSIDDRSGRTTLTITLSDDRLNTTDRVVVTVTPVNDAPTLDVSTTALTLNEDFATTQLITVNRSDIENDTLTLSVAESISGIVSVSTSSAGIQVVRIANADGQTTLTITVSDSNASVSTQVLVTVNAVNDPPTLSVSSNSISTVGGFSPITINTTANDIEDANISFTVIDANTGVVRVTTSTNAVVLNTISGASGQTTLTLRVVDSSGATVTEIITVHVSIAPSVAPVLMVSTNLISVIEDFRTSVIIQTTATDVNGDTITVSVSASMPIVNAVISTPVNAQSIITNSITLTAIGNANGTATLTVQAVDSGGIATTEQIVVVVNAVDDDIRFTLSTSTISLSVPGSQLDRIINAINISNPDNKTQRAQIGVTTSGDNIFSANPIPVVSFTTNALTTTATLTSAASTAQLYFTVAHNQTGTGTLTIHLTNLDDSSTLQQTIVVHVNSVDVPPVIAQYNSDFVVLIIHGGRIYANDVRVSGTGISRFLTTASALGGHLLNINSIEEYAFVRSTASGLISIEPWLGMILPARTFPGELSWITHDSTIAYGYASTDGLTNLTVYPGHATLPWSPGNGLVANRYGHMNTISNWIVNGNGNLIFLVGDVGEGLNPNGSPRFYRNVIYEFPQGLPIASNSTPINVGLNATVRLTSYDLNGDPINIRNWSGTDSNGGSVAFNPVSFIAGSQTVDMVYTPPASFVGQTTVVITLTVGGLSTTSAITFMVPPPPTIALSTNAITLDEDFGTFDIATTATASTSLPFSVQASPSGIVTITTSANNIRLSAVPHANGMVTLTVRTTNSASLTTSTQVLVTVTPVNDPPTLSVSTTALTLNEDFSTAELIIVSRSDIDNSTLTLTVSESTTGVVSVTTTAAGVQVTNFDNANGATTLTISLSDGTTSTSTQVGVTVTPVNDPPTLSVSINNLATNIDFLPITINVILSDVEDSTLSFSVEDSNAGVVTFTTSANTIVLNAIAGVSGQTTLTVSLVDSSGTTVTQTISVNVSSTPNTAPVLVVSTNRITVRKNFIGSVVIRTTATDSDAMTLSVSSSSHLVDVVLSTPVSGVSTITNNIALTALTDRHGTTTLTVQALDTGGIATTEQVLVVVVNAVDDPFDLSTHAITLSTVGEQINRNIQNIIINNPGNQTLRAQFQVTSSGDPIFSTNPIPVVSFTTNALTTITTLTSTTSAAQLYFTIAHNRTGTATLTVRLTNLNDSSNSQQTMVVSVNALNVPPSIVPASSSLTNLVVHGGRLYANDVSSTTIGVSRFLTTARALGGHLANINSVEEFNFLIARDNGLTALYPWLGLVLPQRTFPGELSWITHDSTIAYGYASTDGRSNLTVYPGHITLRWYVPRDGVTANRYGRPTTVFNWLALAGPDVLLLDDGGDGFYPDGSPGLNRNVIYEFPQGIKATSIQPITLLAGTSATVRLTGFDLNGDAISTSDWNVVATTGTASISNVTQRAGVQTVDLVYTAPLGFSGHSTVVVSLQVNGLSTTTALSFVSFLPTFSLASSSIILTENSAQTIRNQQLISNVVVPAAGTKTYDFQWRVTHSGDNIFSTNPAPVVNFTTNALVTSARVGSTAQTAQLYFTIAPDQSGTATLTVQLTNLSGGVLSQQTMVVQVNPMNDVPPVIAQASPSLTNLVVHGGRLYANDLQASGTGISRFLTTARDLGGHLMNVNSVEEYTFVRTPASSGLLSHEAYFGLVLAQRLFPGELSWITHDSTIAYGVASTNGVTNLTVYPGHFPLPWNADTANPGLQANRFGSTTTVSNWPIFAGTGDGVVYLVDNGGDIPARDRNVIYEFPQGLPIASNSTPIRVVLNAVVRITGYDLNGDSINIPNWSGTDSNGGSVIFSNFSQNSGVQRVNMIYTAPADFGGQTTVVVSLGVNGLSTTYAISFIVDGPPTIALSTNAITLAEEFSNFVIGTTVTDQGVSGSLPFSVQTGSTGLVNLTTSINSIQFSGALNFNGRVTLTVQATDSAAQTVSTRVVVTVEGVNDTPTISVSTDNISILGGFSPITIDTTATDVEQGVLAFSVQSTPQGVVSISTRTNAIVLTPIIGGSGRTTLTVSVIDSDNATDVQIIAVNVIVMQSTRPVLRVSTNLISLQENFAVVEIGTTATDAQTGTLLVTVSSSTHLVNMVISTHSITLSSVANLFGTTTLTVRARNPGGLFDSTEVIVIVASVNDIPTLTVSSNTVTLGSSAPVVLNVTASDLEDGILPFGISTGQGVVNIAITTTRLTLTRLNQSGQVLLTLTTTDTEGGTASTVVRVTRPSNFDVTTGIKTFDFAWNTISTATHYQLRSNPDGNSGFTDLSTTGMVVSPNSTNIRQTTAQGMVSLHRYIPRVVDPRYEVYPCNGGSCGASIGNTVTLTNAQLNGMIGRLQASNPDSEDRFGWSVDLSGDGNTLAVGAYRESGAGRGVNGFQNNNLPNSGAVYLFRRIGGVWIQQAYIKASNPSTVDQFGLSVSLNDDGNTLAVGAPNEDGSSTGINGVNNDAGFDTGAVYVFRFNGSVWSQQAYIKASNAGFFDRFGYAVALSGAGNTIAVGARNEGSSSTGVNSTKNFSATDSGATYLFRFDGGMWSQQAYIKASNTLGSDQFGHSVSLNKDGNTLAVGAPNEYNLSPGINGDQNNRASQSFYAAGAVYLFRFNPTSSIWSQQSYIKAPNPTQNAQFGFSVDLSDDGNALAVGAIRELTSTSVNTIPFIITSESGAAYVFRFSTGTSTWSQQAFIKASNAGVNDFFGISVSISGDGNALVVGASGEDGTANGVEGTNHASTISSASGAAYVFEFSNGTWAQQAFIKATDTSANANFAHSVSISSDGGTIAVGAWGVNTNTGAIYLY